MRLSQRRLSSRSFFRDIPSCGGGGIARAWSLRRRRFSAGFSACFLIGTISALGMTALRLDGRRPCAPDDSDGSQERRLGVAESRRGRRWFEEMFPVHGGTGSEDD